MKNSYSKLKLVAAVLLCGMSKSVISQCFVSTKLTNVPKGLTVAEGQQRSAAAKPIIRLVMDKPGFNDETVFYFEQGGTTGFQSAFDAYKLVFNSGTQPYIGSLSDSILTAISGLPELTTNISVPVKAISPVTSSFTFSAIKEDFPENVCVTLYDAFTGISTRILTSNYVCTLYDTTSVARFTMSFFAKPIAITSSIKQASCSSPKGGLITVKGNGNGPADYEWRNANGIVKSCQNKIAGDSLANLNGGTYTVVISQTGQCQSLSKTFTLEQVVIPVASFIPDTLTTTLSNAGNINFQNTSTGSQFNSWDFGDNSGTWFIPSPEHNYQSAGVYTVTLISESIHHCTDTAKKVVTVINDVTGIKSLSDLDDVRLSTLSQGNYEVLFSSSQNKEIEIVVLDLKGSVVKSEVLQEISTFSYPIDLSSNPQGMYLVKVSAQGSDKIFKVIK
jgi:PKD repeat protein